jgi:subtilisin family serine protease
MRVRIPQKLRGGRGAVERGTHRAWIAAGIAALAAAVAVPVAFGTFAAANQAVAIQLSKHERELVIQARARGKSSVTLMFASQDKANGRVAEALRQLGASIGSRFDRVDYLRADVPLDKLDQALSIGGLVAVDVDEEIPLENPRPQGIAPLIPQAVPGAGTPRVNPYMPTQDTRAAQFVNAHQTWDGRGVTIGIVDTGISLDHPSLTTTSTGEAKITNWITGSSPFDTGNGLDPTWIDMRDADTASVADGAVVNATPTFAFDGKTFTAPESREYRIGFFNEAHPRFGGEYSVAGTPGGDLNRDGDETDKFYLLWNTSSNGVHVDVDQDNSFADEPAMADYKVARQVRKFGTDNAATPVKEEVPFVIQTDGQNRFVNLGIIAGAHGSHVAGIAAGNALFGGQMSGAAPGAKIVSSRACLFVAGCFAHALLEGMIQVAQQEDVDVINMSIGGLPALNDGNNARCRTYARLIEQFNVQMFISIGNDGPGINTAGDPGLCDKVMGIGASITKETYLSDYGIQKSYDDSLLYFSSRGPREDGGFQPRIVAPGAAISTIPMWQNQGCLAQTCPVGYALFNGTSMAAPQSTGAAALLLSAAKATNVQHQPAQLRQAIGSTARFITEGENAAGDRLQALDQGDGIFNVEAAWTMLSGAAGGIKTVDISSSVPVSTVLGDFLATPNVGQGIYDREELAATRTYTFTRTGGDGGSVTYNVSWLGNDGTFSSPSSISLGKNQPTTFNVGINVGSEGVHSAILRLDDPSSPGFEYQTLATVVKPHEFSSPTFSKTVTGDIDIAQQEHYFFRIPPAVPALKVDMVGGSADPGTGQMRFLRWTPWGLPIDANSVSNCYNPPAAAGCGTGSPTSRTVQNPIPGVWEITMDARRTSDADDAPFSLAASLLGATVSPNPDTIASATIGVPINRSYTITNQFGAFTGRAVGTALGSARVATPTIANGAQQQFPVSVAAGSTSLRATIGSPSVPSADLDLFVFNCTTGTCVQAGSNADGDSEESVTINNPAAGNWLVVVDGFAVPAGTTTYNYVDVFANPAFGTVSVTDANALRPAGSSWVVQGTVTANAAPAAGRVLLGNVQVRTDTNVLIGSGDVIVQSVTP